MPSHKDLWFAAMEDRLAELEDEGLNADAAYERASEEAYGIVQDRLADHADFLHKQSKE